jgi:hypothetical protein
MVNLPDCLGAEMFTRQSSVRLGRVPRAATRNGCTALGPATGGGGLAERPSAKLVDMAKQMMRVVPEPVRGARRVMTSKTAGSQVFGSGHGPTTYLCGRCRNIILKRMDPDFEFEHVYNEETDDFTPTCRVRDVVFRCKNCGAFNEVPAP